SGGLSDTIKNICTGNQTLHMIRLFCQRYIYTVNRALHVAAALDDLDRLIEIGVDNYNVRMMRAEIAMSFGQIDKARADLETVLMRKKDNAEVYLMLGNIHMMSGERKKALLAFQGAQTLLPNNIQVWQGLARAYGAIGMAGDALLAMAEAIHDAPLDPSLYTMRGRLMAGFGQDEEAAKDFKRALALDDDYAQGWLERGIAHMAAGQLIRAWRDFSETVERAPTEPYPAFYLAISKLRSRSKDLSGLEAFMDVQAARDWPLPVGDYLLGRIDATALMEQAETASTSNYIQRVFTTEARFFIGQKLLADGDKEAGRGELREVVAAHLYEHPVYRMAKGILARP
ncbi:MAG: tetratricopeptide repeat protein, partial [Pseudomonadota bacterium]|nr:tetratricopeptide repeat protein [Pseudomonadota bacterium]